MKTICFLATLLISTTTFAQQLIEVGQDRPAILKLPKGYTPSKKWPLLVLLHGYGSSAKLHDEYSGASSSQDELGYALLLPNGTEDKGGRLFWNFNKKIDGADDVRYLQELIAESISKASIDPDNISIFGHSNGGFMAYRLACEGSKVSTIISLAAHGMAQQDGCPSPISANVIHIHAVDDWVVPYERKDNEWGAYETIKWWAVKNNCPNKSETETTLLSDSSDIDTTIEVWSDCQDDRSVQLWKLHSGGHNPSFRDNLTKLFWNKF